MSIPRTSVCLSLGTNLLQTLHPRYSEYIPRETRVELRQLVEEVANLLGSPDVAVDERHGPALYSRFLKGLLETPLASVDHPPSALKRAARPHMVSPGSPDSGSERPDSSPMPPTPVSVPQPPPSAEQDGPKEEQQPQYQQTSPGPGDVQMFDGLDLVYPDQPAQTINASELYSPPLPFDQELLQSMQSLTDPEWANMVLPGEFGDSTTPDGFQLYRAQGSAGWMQCLRTRMSRCGIRLILVPRPSSELRVYPVLLS